MAEIGDAPESIHYWWHVNKSGFPICQETWDKMWSYVSVVHPDGLKVTEAIEKTPTKKVSIPSVPYLTSSSLPHEAMNKVQTYLDELQYNYTGTQFFDVIKTRPLARLMELAKEMIHESLPIKCLEAVVLGLYLTVPVISLQRFPIGFKSVHNGKYHRHIVLGCYNNGLYGAVGLSRRPTLMSKPLSYKLLSDILEDYISSYEKCVYIRRRGVHGKKKRFFHTFFSWPPDISGHSVIRIKIGAPVVHNIHSCEQIHWKLGVVQIRDNDSSTIKRTIEKYSRLLRTYVLS